jgi:hypothetical protein
VQRGPVAVGIGVDQRKRLVKGSNPYDREHRAEDLVGIDRHLRRHMIEECRTEEEPIGELGGHRLATVDHERRSCGHALVDVPLDAVAVCGGYERSEVNRFASVPHLPYPAETAASAARSRSASGRMTM